jgi:uncharacterized membrane protein
MSDQNWVVYTAAYDDVDDALADMKELEQLHKDDVIGKFDAAVVDKENGKPHIVKRMDRPRVRLIPELVGKGTLPRKELKDAAQELQAGNAGLVAAGEPTLEKGFEKAVTRADKVVKRDLDATADEIQQELLEAMKS